jgi:tetratricopeptide (TPR) repeat protein
MEQFQRALFDKFPPFVVPFSVLLDANRNLVVLYRSSFAPETMLEDRRLVGLTEDALRDAALPFTGRWFTKPATASQLAEFVGQRLLAHQPREGLKYYELSMLAENDATRRAQLRQQLTKTHFSFGKSRSAQGDVAEASFHFQEALRFEPDSPLLHHDFGVHLATHGDLDGAEHQFREALRLRPDYSLAQQNLDLLLRRKRSRGSADD